MKSVVLFSGGLDSTTALYTAKQMGEVIALSFNYGQRHAVELEHAYSITELLGIEHFIVPIHAELFAGSALTGGDDVPEGHYADDNMKATIVPNRNAVMLSMAFALAVSRGYDTVVAGMHAGDHPIYPDCRPEFIEHFQTMEIMAIGGDAPVLWAPFLHHTKDLIVTAGQQLEVPFERTWSCYGGLETHCGRCGTCVERKEAFALAKVSDPTAYADEAFGFVAYRN